MVGALLASVSNAGSAPAAAPEKPVAGKTVHFPDGYWSGLPETGPDKKVRQCVLVAKRTRGAAGDGVDTRLSFTIGRGSGLALAIGDDKLPPDSVVDDQAEIVIGDRAFPATAFMVRSDTLAFHPGDATGVPGTAVSRGADILGNLKMPYLRMPEGFAAGYWRRARRTPRRSPDLDAPLAMRC